MINIFVIYQVSGTAADGGTHVYREKRAWQEHYRSNPRQPESASLEHMLGSLRADMSRQGVQTPQKGCCNACEKPIVGQVDIQSYDKQNLEHTRPNQEAISEIRLCFQ